MKKPHNLGSLSVADTQKLLGAARPTLIGNLPANPLGMTMSASIVRERLVSRGGRPSDPAWTVVRKVPMRPETWAALDRCAQELQQQNVRVSAGQVAAIALERGLLTDIEKASLGQRAVNDNHSVSPAALVYARRAFRAVSQVGLY